MSITTAFIFYLCTLLKSLGYSFQKARFVSDHLDEEKRRQWLKETWPRLLRAAKQRQALILFVDEASFAQWGSLSYTWARQGQTPQVKTSGKRKSCKVFGGIEFFSGRFFSHRTSERFNSHSYQEFLQIVLDQNDSHVFLIQDGARYHLSADTREFFTQHRKRLTVWQLPSYSPDYNPIEYLWRNLKKQATHNKHFADFAQLTGEVERALSYFKTVPQQVLGLFGCYRKKRGKKADNTLQLLPQILPRILPIQALPRAA